MGIDSTHKMTLLRVSILSLEKCLLCDEETGKVDSRHGCYLNEDGGKNLN